MSKHTAAAQRGKQVLAIYLEPTSYILALLERLQQRWPSGITVCFADTNLSQQWNLPLDMTQVQVLPTGRGPLLQALRGLLTSGDYGVVHLAGWAGHPALPLALLLARWYGIPVVVESDTPLPAGLVWWKRAVKKLTYPLLFCLPALFMPGGTRQAHYLRHYGVDSGRIVIAQMTVDTTAIASQVAAITTAQRMLKRQQLGIADDACIFLYVGRLEPHKGLDELLAAFARLPQAGTPVALLLVGAGSLAAGLQHAATEDRRLHCTGRLTGDALLEIYALADVFVLPSRFEPWGLVVNEAMAAGLPVIATDRVGCVDDLVPDGHTGLRVPAENANALAAAMQKLRDDTVLRQRLRQQALRLIADWTLEREADIMAQGWKRVMGFP